MTFSDWSTPSAKIPSVVCILWPGLFVAASAFAQKTDLIRLKKGDRVTAEIKELARGQMRLSSDPFGTISVKWENAGRIVTKKGVQVELAHGTRC